ncbi:hypothetical protein AM493_14475 [Flavobacterium akiainvivens]|uniref:DUF1129 domain-containing protein n=1 Tax=Flavobacterium akiainvivens TaxID=1202724 RepID=A0A0M8MK06_9FLAO|nr:hypothetical protein [Flavobacterium akiainvivens]KOS07108.1 hypothetical protein AM493_14475 [Flavobacterium akiainvivens]SFQ75698.1 hypothetical protein SAMN05444144_12225 [Flavobacterium akiainvivens]
MAAITKHEVQFIDNYLKNSGIVYEDIRYEMADHIASALEGMEGDFIENFTTYMVKHKAELLQNNKAFAINARTRAWNTLGKNLIKPVFFILFALITWGFISLTDTAGPKVGQRIIYYASGIIIIGVFIHGFLSYVGIGKNRYSVPDKLLTSVCIVFYFITVMLKPDRLIENNIALCAYYALILTVLSAVYYTYLSLTKKYKMQFIK